MILTPSQLREHIVTAVEDDALTRLLDAAEAAIIEVAGPPGADVVELVPGGYNRLILSRPAASVSGVRESSGSDWVTYDIGDVVQSLPYVLKRGTGRWSREVEVTYTPYNDAATRMAVQIRLVELALNQPAGVTGNTIGSFAEQYPAGKDYNYEAQRNEILSALLSPQGVVVV